MRVLNVCNLKGGVGKTVTAVNLAFVLAALHGMRVLLIDNDKQGNASKFFGVHDYDRPSVGDLLTGAASAEDVLRCDVHEHVRRSVAVLGKVDCIPANMTLLEANKAVLMDPMRPQQGRLKEALRPIAPDYDVCIIDNAPDENMSVINALAAGDDVLIPVKVDRFTFDGVDEILHCVEQVREHFNTGLNFLGCVITSFRRNEVNAQGAAFLAGCAEYRLMDTKIRWTHKVDESTFVRQPMLEHSPRSGAAKDYSQLAAEYLARVEWEEVVHGG